MTTKRLAISLLAAAAFAGCSGGGSKGPIPSVGQAQDAVSRMTADAVAATTGSLPAPTAPPDATGVTNTVPAPPTKGCRTGDIYNITVVAPTGDNVAFTVFEPAQLCAGKTYPLVFQAPGWSGTRTTTLGSSAPSSTAGLTVGNNLSELVAANYGVISFDQRGMGGGTTGKIRSMDPDFEGKDYLSILD